jgi:phage I-like protein
MSRELLLATAAIAIASTAGGKAPDWVQLLPIEAVQGKSWTGTDGRGPYRVADPIALLKSICSSVSADGKTGACDRLFDYDHQADMKEAVGLPKPAAGWIKQLQIRDDGIYGQVEWTERAAAAIVGREYRYVSPVIVYMKANGAIVDIPRASLTNTPNFAALKAVASRDVHGNLEESMKTVEEVLAALRKALGLKDDADAVACMTAIATVVTASKETEAAKAETVKLQGLVKAVAAKLALKPEASQAEFETAIAGRGAPAAGTDKLIQDLQTQINQLKAANAQTAATDEVEKAIQSRKVSPSLRDWALDYAARDLDGFKKFVEKQPVIVTDSNARGTPPAGSDRDTASEDAEVARQLGIDPKSMKKGA